MIRWHHALITSAKEPHHDAAAAADDRGHDSPQFSPHGPSRTHVANVAAFANHFGTSPDHLDAGQVRTYLLYLLQQKHVSSSVYNQTLCALRFFYDATLGKDWVLERFVCPKQEKTLPVVLSPGEVSQFFRAVTRLKHRPIAHDRLRRRAPCLGGRGLVPRRASTWPARMVIRVRLAGSRKDRYVMLSTRLLGVLRDYWRQARPFPYLFPGRTPGRPIGIRTVQEACRHARRGLGAGQAGDRPYVAA